MDKRFIDFYMDVAKRTAQLSRAIRLQVGAIVVKDDKIVSLGYNGTPKGWDNNCESKEWMASDAGGWMEEDEIEAQWPYVATSDTDGSYIGRYRLNTKPEVLHAESNAISKLARSSESGLDADLFVTHSPCLDCAKLIYQSGIRRVYYANAYRDDSGISFLKNSGVEVEQIDV
jgi:dCMP deaminase